MFKDNKNKNHSDIGLICTNLANELGHLSVVETTCQGAKLTSELIQNLPEEAPVGHGGVTLFPTGGTKKRTVALCCHGGTGEFIHKFYVGMM
jgi:hypothetical protein